MATVSGYNATFTYGATDGTYYYTPTASKPKTSLWVGYEHKGDDYPLIFEPVVVAGTTIGISGATGMVGGPHVHVQAGKDEWAQQTINPEPYTNRPGIVAKTGYASEWGNYVCIKVGDVNVYYCHLDEIKVSVGQIIGEDMNKFTKEQIDLLMQIGQNVPATNEQKDFWSTQDATQVMKEILGSEGSRVFRTKAAQFDNVVAALNKEYAEDDDKKLAEIKKIVES